MSEAAGREPDTTASDARLGEAIDLSEEALRRPMTEKEKEALLERERARLADPAYREELRRMDAWAESVLRRDFDLS